MSLPFSADDLSAITLTFQLALVSTGVLLVLSLPLAWWLAHTSSRWRGLVSALVALPLVLPPTVLGFYLLISMAPHGWLGQITQALGWGTLAFTFSGLVIGSVVYSLPFAVQPLQHAFEAMGDRPLEVAATLGAGPLDRFFTVALPLCRGGVVTAGILSFAHTVGEFGVVLMIGGSISGQTRVVSVQLYDHVEALAYTQAHWLAGLMVLLSLLALLALNITGRRSGHRVL